MTQNRALEDLRTKLTVIDLPLVLSSSRDTNARLVQTFDNEILKRLYEKGGHFSAVGVIFESDDFISILGYHPSDISTPVLVTLDREGNEIETINLFGSVGQDIGYYESNHVTINSDRTITVIDSLLTRKVNEDRSDEIPGTDSLTVTVNKFRINEKGKSEKMD